MTNKSQEVSPFPGGEHKAAMKDPNAWETQDTKTQMIHKRSTALELSVKKSFTLTLQETPSFLDSMNIRKIEFSAYTYILL